MTDRMGLLVMSSTALDWGVLASDVQAVLHSHGWHGPLLNLSRMLGERVDREGERVLVLRTAPEIAVRVPALMRLEDVAAGALRSIPGLLRGAAARCARGIVFMEKRRAVLVFDATRLSEEDADKGEE